LNIVKIKLLTSQLQGMARPVHLRVKKLRVCGYRWVMKGKKGIFICPG
jgi:hypothetical protein